MITLYPKIAITTNGPHIAAYVSGNWVERSIAPGVYWNAGSGPADLVAAVNAALSGTGGQVGYVDDRRRVMNTGSVPLRVVSGAEGEKIVKALGWYDPPGDYTYHTSTPVDPGTSPTSVSFSIVPLPVTVGLVYDSPDLEGHAVYSGVVAAADAGAVAVIQTASARPIELQFVGLPTEIAGGADTGGDSLTWCPQVPIALSPGFCSGVFGLHDGATLRFLALRRLIQKDDFEPMGELRRYWRLRLECARVGWDV